MASRKGGRIISPPAPLPRRRRPCRQEAAHEEDQPQGEDHAEEGEETPGNEEAENGEKEAGHSPTPSRVRVGVVMLKPC